MLRFLPGTLIYRYPRGSPRIPRPPVPNRNDPRQAPAAGLTEPATDPTPGGGRAQPLRIPASRWIAPSPAPGAASRPSGVPAPTAVRAVPRRAPRAAGGGQGPLGVTLLPPAPPRQSAAVAARMSSAPVKLRPMARGAEPSRAAPCRAELCAVEPRCAERGFAEPCPERAPLPGTPRARPPRPSPPPLAAPGPCPPLGGTCGAGRGDLGWRGAGLAGFCLFRTWKAPDCRRRGLAGSGWSGSGGKFLLRGDGGRVLAAGRAVPRSSGRVRGRGKGKSARAFPGGKNRPGFA